MTQNPYTQLFEMHESMIERQQALINRSFETQRELLESMDTGVDAGKQVQSQARKLTDATLEMTMDAMDTSMPGETVSSDEMKDVVDEQLDASEELSEETWSIIESQLDESVSAYGEYLDKTEDLYHELFETYLAAFEQAEQTVDEAA